MRTGFVPSLEIFSVSRRVIGVKKVRDIATSGAELSVQIILK